MKAHWLAVAATALSAPAIMGVAPPAAEIGRLAPDFTIKTFAGDKIKLADLRGQVVVINLWATWCAPCKAEMPMLDAYYRQHHGKGLKIFAVQTQDSVPNYRLKPVQEALSFPLVSRMSGSGNYPSLGGVPTSYVIDRNGVVRYAKSGAFSEQGFDEVVRPLLAQPARPVS